ncbi:uncharacterized protein SCHCODRAFT_02580854 [Schizophyllum commune H4-8]|uniref:Citrate transporter-like domain-containing protein n=1 Tax=Schizophyllum commune (strain H4-8 / FGSC 9210) TaxID=578458 RepID=D8Q7X0_SCHCM|nr:uncharacterized protein SCHCODRAFT_02580854 [Schizophyllum commune H4-8]KAI5891306.1 hypothetical protein SCHCODRAFT_02580854 [Schizophyllum commune H4-8]
MIDRFSIVTLIFFILSVTFVIYPWSFYVHLPYFGRRKIPVNLNTAPILAIAILWAAQCIGATDIRNGIVGTDGLKPYNVLILFITLAYMSITLDATGLLKAVAFWVSNKGGTSGPRLYMYFYAMLTLLTVFIGNDPVILSGTVFLLYYTQANDLEPLPWLMSEFTAANTASMVLFLGNPTNVVICEGFGVNNVAFTVYTILPFVACCVCGLVALGFQFRHPKHIPRRLQRQDYLDPRDVLHDPIGACVGSFIFGACLVVIIVVSFFHIDVWKISLPFALAKLAFDIFWDHRRYVQGQFTNGPESDPTDDPQFGNNQPSASNGASRGTEEEAKAAHVYPPRAIDKKEGALQETEVTAPKTSSAAKRPLLPAKVVASLARVRQQWACHFPTLATALPRLPLALVPFAFSQFILIEGLARRGWIDVFATWYLRATHGALHPTIWLIGVLGIVLCNCAGTNIGATILLAKVLRAAPGVSPPTLRAAAIALAVGSNIGAVGATFCASLAGLLWAGILRQRGVVVRQRTFAYWNLLPLLVMAGVGLGVVSAEMAVLYRK